jgi:hypothetical protein
MTTDSINQKTTYSKLRLAGLLMATALVATACGGGGGGDAAPPAGSPPAGSPPAGSPPAASDVVTLADIKACPNVADTATNTNWYNCLVGKRLVGVDPFANNQVCQLSIKAGGVFEYSKNGAVVSTTRPVAEWASPFGLYRNSTIAQPGTWFMLASISGSGLVTGQPSVAYNIELNIKDAKSISTDPNLNDDKFEFKLPNGTVDNCKLDI